MSVMNTRPVSLTFGERLAVARKRKHMQAIALAREVGVSHPTIARWEDDRGGPKPDQLAAAARALGVSVEWFTNGEDVTPPTDQYERVAA